MTVTRSDAQAVLRDASRGRSQWLALLSILIITALGWFAIRNLSRTAFWYDEAMQFWMSLGLDGFGEPLTARGTLRDVFYHNGRGNLDPGGFSFLLRFWMLAGTGEIWLRTLPFLLFVAGMGALGLLGWTWRRSIPFALLAFSVPAAFPLLLDYSVEVRAYSMEFAGIAIGSLLLARLIVLPTIQRALFAGMVFAGFLTSRYSFAVFSAAAFIAMLPTVLSSGRAHVTSALARLSAFVAPVLVSGLVICFAGFLPQYEARIAYQDGALIEYLSGATTARKSASEVAAMMVDNLLQPAGLPLTIMAVLGLLAMAPRHWRPRGWVGSISPATAFFGLLIFAALVLNALIWRWHPWNMNTKWSLWLHALSAVAVVRLAAGLLEFAPPPASSGWDGRLTAMLLAGVLILNLRIAWYHRPPGNTVAPALTYLESAVPTPGSVAIDGAWYPTVRYLYEYGPFAGSSLYPASFRLPYWNAPQPLVSTQTRFLITYLSRSAAQANYPHATIVQDPDLPSQLYRVEPRPN